MNKFFLLTLLVIFGCAKKQVPEEKPDIFSLKEMTDLATVEYTVTKIIKANDNITWFKPGDRKILMSCEAHIKAGVSLGDITPENFSIDGKNVHLRLPPPKIVSISLPPEKIKVEYQDIGFFRDEFKSEERNALAVQAEVQIKNSIPSLGILDQAKANTSLLVSNFLRQMGYENIEITYSDAPAKNVVP